MADAGPSKASRRLRQLAAAVGPGRSGACTGALQPSAVAGVTIAEMEGAAIGRLSAVRVVLLNVGERGVPLGTDAEVEKVFQRYGLHPMCVQSVEDLPVDTEVLVTMGARIDVGVLAKAPKLKLIAVAFTGTDHIDISACRARRVAVVHVPGYSTDATAELTIGLVLEHLRKLPECHQLIQDGLWSCPHQEDLRSKTVGIIGLGKIGLRLTELFSAFRVKSILGYSLNQPPQFAAFGGTYVDSLAALFLDADIICVCVPLTRATEGFISATLMELLRPDSLLVNVSRGDVVDEVALVKLLSERRFRAALDVFSIEPLPPYSPLRQVPKDVLLMTPHIGYQSEASLAKRLDTTVKNILAYLAGQAINKVV